MIDDRDDVKFDDTLRRALTQRPALPRIPNLAELAISKAALRDGGASAAREVRTRGRQSWIHPATSLAAAIVIATAGWWAYSSGSFSEFNPFASYAAGYVRSSVDASAVQMSSEVELLVLGVLVFLIAVASTTLGRVFAGEPDLVDAGALFG